MMYCYLIKDIYLLLPDVGIMSQNVPGDDGRQLTHVRSPAHESPQRLQQPVLHRCELVRSRI